MQKSDNQAAFLTAAATANSDLDQLNGDATVNANHTVVPSSSLFSSPTTGTTTTKPTKTPTSTTTTNTTTNLTTTSTTSTTTSTTTTNLSSPQNCVLRLLHSPSLPTIPTGTAANMNGSMPPAHLPLDLPRALDHLAHISSRLVAHRKRVIFFLDYDGTLSPIVSDPDKAVLPGAVREALREIAGRFVTAIVTGRSKRKIMTLCDVDQLIYAASHGFDIYAASDAVNERVGKTVASSRIPTMRRVAADLTQLSAFYEGTRVENNDLSITLHYRQLHPALWPKLAKDVDKIAQAHAVRRHDGKMVHELRPPVDWDKGKAVNYLVEKLGVDLHDTLPIFIGDDISDETAFDALHGRGLTIIVADESVSRRRRTSACLRLNDPYEVGKLLKHFASHNGFRR